MGILDNEFLRLALSGSPYMQSRETNRRQDEIGQRYSNLLGSYGQGDQFNGPIQQERMPGLLTDGAPPPAFYLQAAGIPGYQGLAAGAQSGQQAMARQQQGQQWDANNISAAAQAGLDQRGDQFNRGMAMDMYKYNQPGWQGKQSAQQAAAQNSLGWANLAQRKAEAAAQQAGEGGLPKLGQGQMWVQGQQGPMVAPVPGTPGWMDFQTKVSGVNGMAQTMNAYKQAIDQYGTDAYGQGAVQLANTRGAVISTMGALREMGVLDQKEYDRLTTQLPDPTTWGAKLKDKDYFKNSIKPIEDTIRGKFEALQKSGGHIPGIDFRFSGQQAPPPGFRPVR